MAKKGNESKPARKRPASKTPARSRAKPTARPAKPAARAAKPRAARPAAKPAAKRAPRTARPRTARPKEQIVLRRRGAAEQVAASVAPAPAAETPVPAEERIVDMSAFTAGSEALAEKPQTIVVGGKERRRRPRREPRPGGFLDRMRRRKAVRVGLWGIVVLLAVGGTWLIMYPFYTNWRATQIQGHLAKEFTKPGVILAYRSHAIPVGGALTRLKIPKLRVNVMVVEGTTGNALRAGAGHYPGTALPGEIGNVAIAGHRTGFGEPFRHLERMRPGDRIVLETPVGTFTYEVVPPFDGHKNPWITRPDNWTVIEPTGYAALTLTTCDPPHTSKNRLIVRAKLVGSSFAG